MDNQEQENALQTKESGALAMPNYGDLANDGWENTTAQDFVIPYIGLIQDPSPQLKKQKSEYIEGAEAGMLFNTATNELYSADTGIVLIPCITEHLFTEWKPNRGGFVARHELDSPVVAKCLAEQTFGEYKTDAGNDLVESYYIYGVQVKEDGYAPVIMAFSSTKIKTYKKAMSALRTLKGVPLYANQIRITSVLTPSEKGDYRSFVVSPAKESIRASLLAPDSELFLAAKAFKDEVKAGTVKVDYVNEQSSGGKKSVSSEEVAEESAF